MFTIRAMARIGPWSIVQIERVPTGEHCERCEQSIKYVWVCEIDADSEQLQRLGGQRLWRIGSSCGPQLLETSEAIWSAETKKPRSRLQLAKRVDTLLAEAKQSGYALPSDITELGAELLEGTISDREQRRLGTIVADHLRRCRSRFLDEET